MAAFGMNQPVNGGAVDNDASADAGPDRVINERADAVRIPPDIFGERRAVDIGIKADFQAERILKGADDIRIFPARLRGARDIAVGRRSFVQVDWPETADPSVLDRKSVV